MSGIPKTKQRKSDWPCIGVFVPPELHGRLIEIAKDKMQTFSDVVRTALKEHAEVNATAKGGD